MYAAPFTLGLVAGFVLATAWLGGTLTVEFCRAVKRFDGAIAESRIEQSKHDLALSAAALNVATLEAENDALWGWIVWEETAGSWGAVGFRQRFSSEAEARAAFRRVFISAAKEANANG